MRRKQYIAFLFLLTAGLAGCAVDVDMPTVYDPVQRVNEFFWSERKPLLFYDVYAETNLQNPVEHRVTITSSGPYVSATDEALGVTGLITCRVDSRKVAITNLESSALFPLPPGAFLSAYPDTRVIVQDLPISVIHSYGSGAFAVSSNELYRMSNGKWQKIPFQPIGSITAFATTPGAARMHFLGTSQGAIYASPQGEVWTLIKQPSQGPVVALAASAEKHVYAAIRGEGVFVNRGGGTTFSSFGQTRIPSLKLTGIALDASGDRVFVSTLDLGLVTTSASGSTSWVFPELTGQAAPVDLVSLKAVENSLVVGSASGYLYLTKKLSTIEWWKATPGAPGDSMLFVDYRGSGVVLGATASGKIYQWTLGSNSRAMLADLQRRPTGLTVHEGNIWVSSAKGLFVIVNDSLMPVGPREEHIDDTPGELVLLQTPADDTLQIGDTWAAGNLVLPQSSLGQKTFPITARVVDRLDTIKVDGMTFSNVIGIRYAFEYNASPVQLAPYWMIYYSKSIGPVLIDQLLVTDKEIVRQSRAIYKIR